MTCKNILVVDDEKSQLEILEIILTEEGYRVTTARSGEAALEIAKEQHFDLILTDQKMLGMDGIELLKNLFAYDPYLPCILGTAHGSIESAKKALRNGAFDYLEKPYDRETLLKIVRQAILNKNVFVVHGHDDGTKDSVARFLEKLNLRPIILHEQPNEGMTIIEKFEYHSKAGFAVVLLTSDDIGYARNKPKEKKPRARQNVIFELGYFIGALGRNKVCALYKDGVEIPTDYQGILYVPVDSGGNWRLQLAKEIKKAGMAIDLNKAL
jgi:predicted nucleotide-binding protein